MSKKRSLLSDLTAVLPTRETSSRDDDSRLLSKAQVVKLVGRSYPTIWLWQQRGTFPRARNLHGKPVWLQRDVHNWIASLPIQPLKGDPAPVSKRRRA